ncbi:MAG: acetylornithine deacetylase [Sedimentitalea sp.]
MNALLPPTIALLDRLVAHPTVSSDSNLALIEDAANLLDAAGARVDIFRDETGKKANLYAVVGPDVAGGLLLSGHSDVVPVTDQVWQSDPFKMQRKDDMLFGRGTCDMKGFIAAALITANTLKTADLRRPLHIALTYDEEVGCLGARSLIPELAKRDCAPAMAIIGEPTEMRVIEGHKGCCEYTARFKGRAGHGSLPDRGVNAAEYAARYVSKLIELRTALMLRAPQHSRFQPPWTTVNVGRIEGGLAHNVIAEQATVAWEMRPVQDSDKQFAKAEMERFVQEDLLPLMRVIAPEAEVTTEIIGEIEGLEVLDENSARDLVMKLTGADRADVVAFGTEAGLFQNLGMSVVVCGPGAIQQAHTANEFLNIAQLDRCLDMLGCIGQSLTA